MNARHKLNVVYLLGCLLFAVLIGGLTGSDTVAAVVFVLTVAGEMLSGNLRYRRSRPYVTYHRPKRKEVR